MRSLERSSLGLPLPQHHDASGDVKPGLTHISLSWLGKMKGVEMVESRWEEARESSMEVGGSP